LRDQLARGHQTCIRWRCVADPAGGPLRTAMTVLAIGLSEQRTPGNDVGIGLARRRNRGANSARDESFDRIPGAHAAHLQLLPSTACRREGGHVRVWCDAVGQYYQPLTAGDTANVSFEILFFIEDRRP